MATPELIPKKPVHVVCWGPSGTVVPEKATLMLDDASVWPATIVPPQVHFAFPVWVQYGWHAALTVTADHFKADPINVTLAADINVTLQPIHVDLPVLERHGQYYFRNGQPFTVIEASGFRLAERILAGQDPDPFLADLEAEGFNTVRVWLLNTSVGHIVPAEHGDFYGVIPAVIDACAKRHLYPEFTVFTQTQSLMPSLAQQQAHYDATVNAIGARFCFVEGVNENDQHDNGIDPHLRFWKPAGATFDLCRGSNGSDGWAVEPVIDSARYHSNDANEWWRRQAHNGMDIADRFGVPCIANENTRPDHDGNPNHHEDAAAGAALLSAGSCFHSTSGKDAVPFSDADRGCARAFVRGAKSVDLTQRLAGYVHRSDLEGPTVIRCYQRGSQLVRIRA